MQVGYLESLDADMAKHDKEDGDWHEMMKDLLRVQPRERDLEWMFRRRALHGSRARAMMNRERQKLAQELEHARKVRAKVQEAEVLEGSARAVDAVELTEFTQEALSRLRAKEDDDACPRAVSGQEGDEHNAKLKYYEFFLADSGRTPQEGTFGVAHWQDPCTAEQKEWDDERWANHFLWLGGFEPSYAGAEAEDKDGWLALHHAIQSTVHWTYGIKAARGLIEMMPIERLRAKTRAGRPAGYTAMHLAANGSDSLRMRWTLVDLLLQKRVSPNVTDDKGRTPLHLAAGTGVTDVAKILVEGRADLKAVDNNGKNALDKALRSSGSMTKCSHPPPSQASVTVQYSRHVRWR